MMKKFTYLLLLTMIVVAVTGCSDKDDCDPDQEDSPCFAGVVSKGDGEFACFYKLSLDGQQTLPNQFGQDKMVLQMATDQDNKEIIVFTIQQGKTDPKEVSTLAGNTYAYLPGNNTEQQTAVIENFQTTAFHSPTFSLSPFFTNVEDHYGDMNLTVLERSKTRVRVKISGQAMKLEDTGEGLEEKNLVPVEAEITIGQKHFAKLSSIPNLNGIMAGCSCQK